MTSKPSTDVAWAPWDGIGSAFCIKLWVKWLVQDQSSIKSQNPMSSFVIIHRRIDISHSVIKERNENNKNPTTWVAFLFLETSVITYGKSCSKCSCQTKKKFEISAFLFSSRIVSKLFTWADNVFGICKYLLSLLDFSDLANWPDCNLFLNCSPQLFTSVNV